MNLNWTIESFTGISIEATRQYSCKPSHAFSELLLYQFVPSPNAPSFVQAAPLVEYSTHE